jgi:hypothetical protein
MKTKKIKSKLTLNKKTIAHLNGMDMDNLKGGVRTTGTIVVSVCLCCTDEYTKCLLSCADTCNCPTNGCPTFADSCQCPQTLVTFCEC